MNLINYYRWINSSKENRSILLTGKIIENEVLGINKDSTDKWNKYIDTNDIHSAMEDFGLLDTNYLDEASNFHNELRGMMVRFRNELSSIYSEYFISKGQIRKEMKSLTKRLKISRDNDFVETQKKAEIGRQQDQGPGIFEPDEIQNRVFYNTFINKYVSDKTNNLTRELNSRLIRGYAYMYIKIEQLLTLTYSQFKPKKELLNWSEKYKKISWSLGWDAEMKKEIDRLTTWSNHIKHQSFLPLGFQAPSVDEYFDFFEKIHNSIMEGLVYKEYIDSSQILSDDVDGILNPLGLTGFE